MPPTITWMSNRKVLTPQYLPDEVELPPGDLKMLVYDFALLAARQTLERSKTMEERFLCWGITANDTDAAGFRLQIFHVHGSEQHTLLLRHMLAQDITGTGSLPFVLKRTRVFERGDTVSIEVRNLSAVANATIQVVLWGAYVTL